jgi:hypothetical protein
MDMLASPALGNHNSESLTGRLGRRVALPAAAFPVRLGSATFQVAQHACMDLLRRRWRRGTTYVFFVKFYEL